MPGTAIQRVLGAENLVGLIQDVMEGLPRPLPPALYDSNESCEGNQGKYNRIDGNRALAQLVQFGSPSQRVGLKGIKETPVALIHTFEHQVHAANVYQNLNAEDSDARQRKGEQTIARHVRDFAMRFTNLRTAAINLCICRGIIHVGDNGVVLDTSSGAIYSIDYQVPAGHKNQLNVFGGGDLFTANWTLATADITGDIVRLRKAARKKAGYPLRHAIHGENIPGYIFNNNMLNSLIRNSENLRSAASQGVIPNGLLGFEWWPGYEAFFEDSAGALKDIVGPNDIVFIPEVSPDWYDLLEGTYLIPGDAALHGDASSAMDSMSEAVGAFSYAEIITDAPGIKHMAGDTFLPVLKVPTAIYISTVKTS
jgi:hypothetical protein